MTRSKSICCKLTRSCDIFVYNVVFSTQGCQSSTDSTALYTVSAVSHEQVPTESLLPEPMVQEFFFSLVFFIVDKAYMCVLPASWY